MAKYLYHKKHNIIYGWNALTAEQIEGGFNTDLMILEDDDPRVAALLPKKADDKKHEPKASRGRAPKEPTAELPESVLTTAAA